MTPLDWAPGWRQCVLPLASHAVVVVVALLPPWGWGPALLLLLVAANAGREAACLRRLRGRRCLVIPTGDGVIASQDPVVRRVLWCLPTWITLCVGGPRREVVNVFAGEMSRADFAALARWALSDRRRRPRGLSLRRAATRRADP